LRRLGLGRAGELALVDLSELDAGATSRVEEDGAAGSVRELRGDEHPSNREGRLEELRDGAHTFGDEQTLPLASAPSPEVAG
jgi:hypothetical protein